jgi:hypothetical protein
VVAKDGFGETIMTVPSTQTVVIIQKATSITGLPATKLITSEIPVAAMSYTVQPSLTNDKSVVWTSSNDSIATVTAGGSIFPHKNGTCIIKVAMMDNPSIYAECVCTVSGVFDYCMVEYENKCVSYITTNKMNKAAAATHCTSNLGTLPAAADVPGIIAKLNELGIYAPNGTHVVTGAAQRVDTNAKTICGDEGRWSQYTYYYQPTIYISNGIWGVSEVANGYSLETWCPNYGGTTAKTDPASYSVACVRAKLN